MKRFIVFGIASFCLAMNMAQADQAATEQLIEELSGIKQLQGSFVQRNYTRDSSTVMVTSSGDFKFLRPGYFSWALGAPDQQLIVANLEFLWHYDIDLETVTRRPVRSGTQISPLQILSGDSQVLRDNFDVSVDSDQQYFLEPHSGDAGFNTLRIRLERGAVSHMQIVDKLNQRIEIDFHRVDRQSALSPADFAFTPPDGVDLFSYDE